MATELKRILAIDPGSTSTKFGLYEDEKLLLQRILRHSEETMQGFKGKPLIEQCDFRRTAIRDELERAGLGLTGLAAVVGRGGLLKPLSSGTYRVTQRMLDDLRAAARGEHASNLGAFLAQQLAEAAKAPAFVVDPVAVDEWLPRARLSGSAELPRQCLSHALNTKAVARRFARERGRRDEDLRLVVAHLGSGVSVSAHENGRMVDVNNSREEGPFSTERAGSVPAMMLVDLCFSGKHTRREVENRLFREGGLYSYLGTRDLVEVEKRIASGDSKAALVWEAMIYQIAKEIGAMAAALEGRVDAVLVTGGMAHSEQLVKTLRASVEWIAPVHVYPGEDELQALAEGALRALRGEEVVREYEADAGGRQASPPPVPARDRESLRTLKSRLLFTPGPVTTSSTVKQAMMQDLGSRDIELLEVVRGIRRRLLELGNVAGGAYEAVLMQGSGTFAVESVISSLLPRDGRLLVLINGAYGHRMAKIARTLGIATENVIFSEARPVDPVTTRETLRRDPAISHVGTIHCETSTGIMNPLQEIGAVVKELGRVFIVDAMSSFGGVPIDLAASNIDFLISSANKCIQGVPGFGFALARRDLLMAAEGRARSVSLDLVAQWKGLECDGQFRFTPPTHALLAFRQALEELEAEGGVSGRAARFASNQQVLMEGMTALGFKAYLAPEHQSSIITSFRFPAHPNFNFKQFYYRLREQGFVIYPGKVSDEDCFRIGTIGHLFPHDLRSLIAAVRRTLDAMQIDLPRAVSMEAAGSCRS